MSIVRKLADDCGSLESRSKALIKNILWAAAIFSAGVWIIGLVFGQ